MSRSRSALVATLALVAAAASAAPESGPAPLDATTRAAVLADLLDLLDEDYVIPATAQAIRADLESREERGEFDGIESPEAYAVRLTELLYELSGDLHLRVRYGEKIDGEEGPTPVRVVREDSGGSGRRVVVREGESPPAGTDVAAGNGAPAPERRVVGAPAHLRDVTAFPRAEMLDEHVGLVEVRLFAPREYAEAEAVAAMRAVEDADALIFDLRGCMGGAPDMVHLITSYLLPPEPIHLLTYYFADAPPDSAWSLAEIPGKRMADIPVWVLVSPFTGSGGEEFAYGLKHHGRATLVGQTTAGAGHGGGVHPLPAGFSVFVPVFRPVHPATGGGWEGVGVVPNVEASPREALPWAHRAALETLLPSASPAERDELTARIAALDAELAREPQPLPVEGAADYAGTYGIRTIEVREGFLHLKRQGGRWLRLLPTAEADVFEVEILPEGKVVFVRDSAGAVTALKVRQPDGTWDTSERGGA